jgi:acetate kinase
VELADHLTTVLVVNAGSSSLKLSLLDGDETVATSSDAGLASFVSTCGTVDAVGHRVVHGGTEFTAATLIDDAVLARIEALTPLAPLHQPRALELVREARALLPDVPHVACFDTAFHATIPDAAATYALPREWRKRWPLRRFGFHGLSHAYAARRAAALVGRSGGDLRIVTCHLGAGASLCAVLDGRSVDTTMGMTPLEGLVMATRSGTVDPGLLLWLVQHGPMSVEELADVLEHRSGLAGLTGGSGDMREVARPSLAFDVYVHRLRREIGAMAASLDGIDVLAFTGGVGEHAPEVRAAAADGLSHLGVALDGTANTRTTADGDISAGSTAVRTVVVTSREDLEIAAQVRRGQLH